MKNYHQYLIVSIISCFVFSATLAYSDTYSYNDQAGKWKISGDKDTVTHEAMLCVAAAKNRQNSRLGLALASSIDGLMIVLQSNEWYKITSNNIRMIVQTDRGFRKTIRGAVIKKGKIHLNTSRSFLTELRRANYVSFSQHLYSESFSLKGSSKAIQKLKACADSRRDLSS